MILWKYKVICGSNHRHFGCRRFRDVDIYIIFIKYIYLFYNVFFIIIKSLLMEILYIWEDTYLKYAWQLIRWRIQNKNPTKWVRKQY